MSFFIFLVLIIHALLFKNCLASLYAYTSYYFLNNQFWPNFSLYLLILISFIIIYLCQLV